MGAPAVSQNQSGCLSFIFFHIDSKRDGVIDAEELHQVSHSLGNGALLQQQVAVASATIRDWIHCAPAGTPAPLVGSPTPTHPPTSVVTAWWQRADSVTRGQVVHRLLPHLDTEKKATAAEIRAIKKQLKEVDGIHHRLNADETYSVTVRQTTLRRHETHA